MNLFLSTGGRRIPQTWIEIERKKERKSSSLSSWRPVSSPEGRIRAQFELLPTIWYKNKIPGWYGN